MRIKHVKNEKEFYKDYLKENIIAIFIKIIMKIVK